MRESTGSKGTGFIHPQKCHPKDIQQGPVTKVWSLPDPPNHPDVPAPSRPPTLTVSGNIQQIGKGMKCRDCNEPAYAVDVEYDEGYCETHFEEQQSSTEPITNIRYL